MQTDSHIEIVSPNRYYAYSRHTERIFCNYESFCQTRVNPMLVLSRSLHPNNFIGGRQYCDLLRTIAIDDP